jgi:hypothetical protein
MGSGLAIAMREVRDPSPQTCLTGLQHRRHYFSEPLQMTLIFGLLQNRINFGT